MFLVGAWAHQGPPAVSGLGAGRNHNPKPFHEDGVSPSQTFAFLLSPQGKRIAARHPNVIGLMKSWGVPLPSQPLAQQVLRPRLQVNVAPSETMPCDTSAGALFNLETAAGSPEIGIAVPQNEESVDYIPNGGQSGADLVVQGANDYRGLFDAAVSSNKLPPPHAWGFSVTGYYVHRAGNNCSPSFEGGLPHLVYPPTQEILYGGGDPVIATDTTRGRIYAADLRFGGTATGMGLFATTAARLNDPVACPDGTHFTDANGQDTASAVCWPTGVLLNGLPPGRCGFGACRFIDKPHMRADERSTGIGAGDVYVSWTFFDLANNTSFIQLTACPATFSSPQSCSPAFTISGADTQTQFSHLSVRPDGVVTITYVSVNFIPTSQNQAARQTFDIRYLSCVPNGAPNVPSCSQPSPITTEATPLYFGGQLAANIFRASTYPTHDQRKNGNAFEEFVVWSRCKTDPLLLVDTIYSFVICSDADLLMTWATTDSTGRPSAWSPVTPFDIGPHDQLMPWVRTDHSRDVINVAYLSAQADVYGHRLQTINGRIDPGSYKPNLQIVTPEATDPNADYFLGPAFFGDYIGVAGRGNGVNSRAYTGFTGTIYKGNVQGRALPGQNNLLSAIDY